MVRSFGLSQSEADKAKISEKKTQFSFLKPRESFQVFKTRSLRNIIYDLNILYAK